MLGRRASFEDATDVLGNFPEIVRKHYAKWCSAGQVRIEGLMQKVHSTAEYRAAETSGRLRTVFQQGEVCWFSGAAMSC